MKDDTFTLTKQLFPPIHPDGWNFVIAFAVASLVLFLFWQPLGWIGVMLTIWCFYFFRDPKRIPPDGEDLILSPADGLVCAIATAAPPPELGMAEASLTRVSIFMNVFNVHVNRAPARGTITRRVYTPGKFFNASLDKSSVYNERMALRMTLEDGREIAFVQIAGLVARRIRCDVKSGQAVKPGERFGLIRFGSRLDVYLPPGASTLMKIGQTAVAGETILATLGPLPPAGEESSEKQ